MSVTSQLVIIASNGALAGFTLKHAFDKFQDNKRTPAIAGLVLTTLFAGTSIGNAINLESRINNTLEAAVKTSYQVGQSDREQGIDFYSSANQNNPSDPPKNVSYVGPIAIRQP